MRDFLSKTIGGLSAQYLFRQFVFSTIMFSIFFYSGMFHGNILFLFVLNTILYPYSRFMYESVVDFFVGNNVFIWNAVFMLAVKIVTMLCCWALAVYIAPIGFVFLYFYHRRAAA